MATKSDKYSFIGQSFIASENQYYNLNLNESEKCVTIIHVHSNSKQNNDKYYGLKNCCCSLKKIKSSNISDNYEKKEESQLWNKSSKISSFTTLNEDNDDLKKRWKNENTLNTTDKSTLFLHIGAYENSNETAGSDLFDDENIVRLRKGKFGSVKKRSFSDSLKCRNPFEFLRQQNGDQRNKPEVMQFKASQQLICPNRPSDISAGKNMTKSMVDREMVVKMIQSILAQNTIDPDATQRLYECTMVLAEKVLDYAIEAAKLRNSDKIEKCDIEMAITLIKQA